MGKLKGQIKRIAAALVVFGISAAVLAYFLGYYDLSFLDRYRFLDALYEDETTVQKNPFAIPSLTEDPTGDGPALVETDAVGAETSSDGSGGVSGAVEEAGETASVLGIHDTGDLADMLLTYPTVAELTAASPAVQYEPGKTRLARMTFSYKLPDKFSLRRRVVDKVSYVVPVEDGAYVAQYNAARESRPAVELYMGYLLIDNQKTLYLIGSDGTPLCSFDDNVYSPAYTRDKEGRPLFVKELGDGSKVWYHLSEDGKNFVKSDYNDRTDSRGLYFDYPADWGLSKAPEDQEIVRDYNGRSGLWAYQKGEKPLTAYTFTNAYAYSEGRACVTTNRGRGGMYFLDENGNRMQSTFVTYLFSDYNRYVIWDYAFPASFGEESLGFFYYDHGLTRVRYQIIDYWNWAAYRRVRVTSDEDKLIRTDGSIYALPVGYTLKGYSEGMILLEKEGRYGFMDYTGGWIAQPCYISATPFVCGLSVLETSDGRYGMIDVEGNIVLSFTYDYISQSSSGLIAAYRAENGWTVFRVVE